MPQLSVGAMQPIKLYSHPTGPNPWKVAIVLEELGVPYTTTMMEMSDLKKPKFEKLNPNGRVPYIEDPNTGVGLWESGAIIEYLIESYDPEDKLSYGNSIPEKYQCRQWLYFQVSGQGPYYGQKAWFTFFHQERGLQTAIDRYGNEIKRVVGVLDKALADNGTGWLVGDKCTYADLSFIPWNMMLMMLMGSHEGTMLYNQNKHFKAWHETMMKRPAVMKCAEDKRKAMPVPSGANSSNGASNANGTASSVSSNSSNDGNNANGTSSSVGANSSSGESNANGANGAN